MITAASFSERSRGLSLYRTVLERLAPMGALYAVLMLAVLPLTYWMELAGYDGSGELRYQFSGPSGIYTWISAVGMVLICSIAPVVLGAVAFAYLHSKRATDVYHALALRRETLFLAHYGAGLAVLWLPLILSFGAVLAVGGAYRGLLRELLRPGLVLEDLLCWMVMTLAIYTVTALVAVLAGNSFDNAVFSLGLCGVAPVLLWLVCMAAEELLLGFSGDWSWRIMQGSNITQLSPFSMMGLRLSISPGSASHIEELAFHRGAVLVWAALSLGLLALALWLYRGRKSELAGRTTAKSALNTILKYTVVFSCGVMFGLGMSNGGENILALILFAALAGGISGVIFEAVTARGFKTFPRAFLHLGAALGLTLAFLGVLITGGLGFEERIPQAAQVEAVTIDYNGHYGARYYYGNTEGPEGQAEPRGSNSEAAARSGENYWDMHRVRIADPAGIEAVIAMHQGAVADGQAKRAGLWMNENGYGYSAQITYYLRDGSSVSRRYYECSAETLRLLAPLEDLEEFKRQTNPAFLCEAEEIGAFELMDRLGRTRAFGEMTPRLLEALRQDILEERLREIQTNSTPVVGYLRIMQHFSIPITTGYENTLTLLGDTISGGSTLASRFQLDESLITRAGIIGEAAYRYYIVENGLYFRVDPEDNPFTSYEVFRSWDYGKGGEWQVTEDPGQIRQLLEAAQNQGDWVGKEWRYVCFEYGGEGSLALLVPVEKLPRGIVEELPQETEEDQIPATLGDLAAG